MPAAFIGNSEFCLVGGLNPKFGGMSLFGPSLEESKESQKLA